MEGPRGGQVVMGASYTASLAALLSTPFSAGPLICPLGARARGQVVMGASYTASLAAFLATSTSVPIVVEAFGSITASPAALPQGRICMLQSAQVRCYIYIYIYI